MKGSDAYDVVIIGAGIGGLVCGCYLAKAGMKVLIAEQHYKPGGYCTSFKRNLFTFDAAAHSFGGYREGGIVRHVVGELGIEDRLVIRRNDPSDTIITPEHRLSFWSNIKKTVQEFKDTFPDEQSSIESFFRFMMDVTPQHFIKLRKLTFSDMLNRYFRNDKLKAILSQPLFCNSGLPSSQLSFCAGATIYSEFLIDGGYYPVGGMQALSDAFAGHFREHGGDLRVSCRIKKIHMWKNRAIGIITQNNELIRSKQVISNADARTTFFSLIGGRRLDAHFKKRIKAMQPSSSYVIVYVGLNGNIQSSFVPGTTVGYLPQYDLEKAYAKIRYGKITKNTGYIMRLSSDMSTLTAIVAAPFKNEAFWKENKKAFADAFIDHIERTALPDLHKHIQYSDAATPYTLRRYTGNYRGSAYGWASIPSQFADMEMKKPPHIQNLFLAGHWTTQGIGITGVVYSGRDTAHLVQKRHHRKLI